MNDDIIEFLADNYNSYGDAEKGDGALYMISESDAPTEVFTFRYSEEMTARVIVLTLNTHLVGDFIFRDGTPVEIGNEVNLYELTACIAQEIATRHGDKRARITYNETY